MSEKEGLEGGFYWVQFEGISYFEVGLLIGDKWFMTGAPGSIPVVEVDPRRLEREENK